MEAILETRFQRIESALQTLIDSITTYNPSPSAAIDLVKADDELSHGLELLTEHQRNYVRIQTLQNTAASLDAQLKSSLSQLAAARKELLAAPLSPHGNEGGDDDGGVDYETLVGYARRISKYTVPPTLRQRISLPEAKPRPGTDTAVSNGGADATAARGAAAGRGLLSPVGPTEQPQAHAQAQALIPGETPPADSRSGEGKEGGGQGEGEAPTLAPEMTGLGWTALSAQEKAQLDRVSAAHEFVPFPRDEEVRSGGLARLAAMVEQGLVNLDVDGVGGGGGGGGGVMPLGQGAELDGVGAAVDGAGVGEHETGGLAKGDGGLKMDFKRGAAGAGEQKEQPAFAGLELYDPDED